MSIIRHNAREYRYHHYSHLTFASILRRILTSPRAPVWYSNLRYPPSSRGDTSSTSTWHANPTGFGAVYEVLRKICAYRKMIFLSLCHTKLARIISLKYLSRVDFGLNVLRKKLKRKSSYSNKSETSDFWVTI